jgi:hypothetical protein
MSIIAGTAIESALGAYELDYGVRFNSADSAYLSWTPASNGTRTTWTISCWVKRSTLSTGTSIVGAGSSGSAYFWMGFDSSNRLVFEEAAGGINTWYFRTTPLYRDPSAWYHIVAVLDTTQATSTNRVKLYVNGVQVTAFDTNTYPSQNLNSSYWDATSTHNIGAATAAGTGYFNGYIAEFNFIDGQALTPSSFGEYNTQTGVWQPIEYAGSYGTNGFYLPFNQEYASINADFLVVAGGGGGGYDLAGGGGAGGYREFSTTPLYVGLPLTVTVGGGGSAGTSNQGGDGSNSVLYSITAAGGGGGGGDGTRSGRNGGSGGGTCGNPGGLTGGSGNTPSTSPSQGSNGGTSSTSPSAGSGGGGASAAGGTNSSGNGGGGGNGTASSITGSSVTRAGGGGGGHSSGTSTSNAGGAGGGGNGGRAGIGSIAGSANTGGGGGGGYGLTDPNRNGAAGGSGIVIVKLPDTHSAVFSSGVTYSRSSAVSGYNIYSVTATSTTSETMTLQEGFTANFLVVAGGGGGGRRCGGGAGGYRSAYSTENTGGGQPAETPLSITLGTAYTVTVGAGGTGTVETNDNTVTQAYNGSNSVFGSITSTGGGAGATQLNTAGNGGSGGGGGDGSTTGAGTSGQGYDGGTSGAPGGGGSAAVGVSASPGAGGSGQASSITGSSVARGGGGGGSSNSSGAGGYGGGGAGATYNGYNAQSGTANTGGGGGSTGGGASTAYGGNGGSGVVVIRVPVDVTATFSGGVTSSSTTSGGYKIYTVTATSTTSETVTFS